MINHQGCYVALNVCLCNGVKSSRASWNGCGWPILSTNNRNRWLIIKD